MAATNNPQPPPPPQKKNALFLFTESDGPAAMDVPAVHPCRHGTFFLDIYDMIRYEQKPQQQQQQQCLPHKLPVHVRYDGTTTLGKVSHLVYGARVSYINRRWGVRCGCAVCRSPVRKNNNHEMRYTAVTIYRYLSPATSARPIVRPCYLSYRM